MLAVEASAPSASPFAELERLRRENAELKRKLDWSAGRRADGVVKIPGFTATETSILRKLVARRRVLYEDADIALQRHMCNIRRKLRERNWRVEILTEKNEGYLLNRGAALLRRLLLPPTTARGMAA